MLLGMNCGQPMAPAYEPSKVNGSMPDSLAYSRVFSSSLRKKLMRASRVGVLG